MTTIKALEPAYADCLAEGKLQFREDIDIDLARSLLDAAKDDIKFIKLIERKPDNFSFLFCAWYDAMRKLIHILTLFDRLKPKDHHCTVAFLCIKHPEYELDWNTLETMRMLRNKIQYRGHRITNDVWTEYKLKFDIYIVSLQTFIKERLEKER